MARCMQAPKTAGVGAATLLHRQGGLRGGGLSAVGSAALHAARVRAGAVVGRTPLAGLQRGYSSVESYHQMAHEHAYELETARALRLELPPQTPTPLRSSVMTSLRP